MEKLKKIKKIHFIGVCGYIMSAAAAMLAKIGYQVSGSDESAYPPGTEVVDRAGVKRFENYSALNLQGADLVVIGNHINQDNVEARFAFQESFPVMSLPQLIGQLFSDKQRLVVAGTHGKSTTTALIAWCLRQAGLEPSYLVGGVMKNTGQGFNLGKGDYLVIEGDEYRTSFFDNQPKFFHYRPKIAVLTNCELDHPDFFKDLAAVKKTFQQFLNFLPNDGLAVLGIDCPATAGLATNAKLTFGLTKKADYQAVGIRFEKKTQFQVKKKGRFLSEFTLSLPGEINVQNALAAITVSDYLGASLTTIKKAIASFQGVGRRFEIVGQPGGITVVDDYAHHPTKISKTLAAARSYHRQGKIYAIFEPHTYSRTKALLFEYGKAFSQADEVIIASLMPAREKGQKPIISSQDVVHAISLHHSRAIFLDSDEKIINHLAGRAQKGDLVILMSVSGMNNLAGRIFDAIQAK